MLSFFRKKRIYLDYAGATPVLPEAERAEVEASRFLGNPGAIHTEGVLAKQKLDSARETLARALGCKARELIFTSGGTEANNLALLGAFKKIVLAGLGRAGKKPSETHWIVSAIEHASVLECFDHIAEMGGIVSKINPDSRGLITVEAIQKELRKETVLVSIGWANNEIGTAQPLQHISQMLRTHEMKHGTKIIFHTDAGQAPLYLSPQVNTLGVDLFVLDSGKLYGPRGVGCLYLSNRAELAPMILGGGQERGLRSGTENVALAAGFAKAFEIISSERKMESVRLQKLRDNLAQEIVGRIPGALINGDLKYVLPHILNISIPSKQNGEYVALTLDHAGVAVATKSACREGDGKSAVVAALGGEKWRAENTLRISLGRDTSLRDVRAVLGALETFTSK